MAAPESGLRSQRHRVVLVLVVSATLLLAAQRLFAAGPTSGWAVGVWLVGVAGATWALAPAAERTLPLDRVKPMPVLQSPRGGWRSSRTLTPVGITALAMVVIWIAQTSRAAGESRWDLVPIWLLSIVSAVLVVWRPPAGGIRASVAEWWNHQRGEVAIVGALTVGAGLLTCVRLGTFPWTFNLDEGGFALVSAQMVDGTLRDPFNVGYLGHPTLYNATHALSIEIFGRSVAATRVVSAILGAICAPLAYAVARRWSDRRVVGITAAVLLATFEMHLFWSRNALPNIASEFFVLLVVLLLDRALVGGTPTAWLLTGVAVGMSQYFYFSNRVLLPVVIIAIVVAVVRSLPHEQDRRDATTLGARRLLLVIGGFTVAVLPMLAFFYRSPARFAEREHEVSAFANGWLLQRARDLGWSPLHVLWDQFVTAALLPFRSVPHGFYRAEIPSVGWPMAVFGAVGLALVTLRAGHRRLTAPVGFFWVTCVGMAMTRGAAETNRWVMAIPLFCLFAAVGLVATVDTIVAAMPRTRVFVVAAACAIVVVAASLSMHSFFTDDDRIEVYSDTNTEVAEHLAREVLSIDPAATVYFSGSPRMWYHGFGDLVFRTPDVTAVDLDVPWSLSTPRPVIESTTIFVVLPERSNELSVLRSWFPDGEVHELSYRGEVLYTSLVVRPSDVAS